mgnify:CR=1 FL=1
MQEAANENSLRGLDGSRHQCVVVVVVVVGLVWLVAMCCCWFGWLVGWLLIVGPVLDDGCCC